ncbi:MAG: HAD family hydrolase [Hyphomonas sp.]
MTPIRRIAMWSGPRNMSTTMMRSFGARADCTAVDEPFYAAWLVAAGETHPMQAEILASQPNDPHGVADRLLAPLPDGATVQFQKQMTHHLLPEFPLDWAAHCDHAFLIRHPARVIASYARKMDDVSLEAIGFPQQARLFDEMRARTGKVPPVIDSDRVLADPHAVLARLCSVLEIPWDEGMLAWQPGPKPEDGAWAPHWYDNVWKSEGFGDAPGPLPVLDGEDAGIEKEALAIYERLLQYHV